ncbi:MAG TPA: NAD(P)/FAD-dependent oxidoreductase [Xanthobacteraceae bacterium]|nr:NAD(P)/FAD-dependent oxidoreductase [Xanthobacteraceae bacterium]
MSRELDGELGIDLIILGAGPAGMAAAVAARKLGLSVTVIDEQPTPGGQIWRAVDTIAATPHADILGVEYRKGAAAADAFRASGAVYEAGAQLWQIEPGSTSGFRAFVTRDGKAWTVTARAVLLATGAQERPVPFPGWTLPGVLTVGAAQILLKSARQIPAKPVVIAGCGPLPLLYATQLIAAGGQIAGFLDTSPPGRLGRALPHLTRALAKASDLWKGLGWMQTLRREGVPVIRHVAAIEALGNGRVERVYHRTHGGAEAMIAAETVFVHEGIVPNVHVAMSLGCAMAWKESQDCYVPVLDEFGETSLPGAFIAGDGAGIAGATAAGLRGEIAAIGIAAKLGALDAAEAAAKALPRRRQLERELALRPLLDAMFRPRAQVFAPADDTIVCRCEEVTAGTIRAQVKLGRPGPNQVKAFTRAGMGPCQGRQCGYTVTRVLAAAEGRPAAEVGFYRVRPPLKPVTLGELASLDTQRSLI